MTKKYTPGPWELDEEIPPNVYAVCGKDGEQPLVALTSNLPFPFAGVDNIDEEEANARLIACTPLMDEFIEKWIYEGALQTFENREKFRKEGLGILSKIRGEQ